MYLTVSNKHINTDNEIISTKSQSVYLCVRYNFLKLRWCERCEQLEKGLGEAEFLV